MLVAALFLLSDVILGAITENMIAGYFNSTKMTSDKVLCSCLYSLLFLLRSSIDLHYRHNSTLIFQVCSLVVHLVPLAKTS